MALVRPTGTGLIRPTGTGLIRPANVGLVRTSAGGPTGYLAAVLADSPAGYWKLDEPSGAVMNDSSGNLRNGTYNSAPTLNQAPLINAGAAVAYTGANFSRIPTAAGFNANGAITLEAWVKTTAAAGNMAILCSDDTGGSRYFQWNLDGLGRVVWTIFDTSVATHVKTSAVSFNDGTRHHVVSTYDGATIRIYKDGVEDGSGTASVFALATGNSGIQIAERLSLGADSNFYTGTMDECAIYTTALSAARIAAHFAAGTA